jgi:hypothetical protein
MVAWVHRQSGLLEHPARSGDVVLDDVGEHQVDALVLGMRCTSRR